jgi:spore coat protein A, manganese oxidase
MKRALLFLILAMWCVTGKVALSQSLLDPASQQKFVNLLPVPGVMQPLTPGGTHYEVSMSQFTQYLGLKDANGDSLFTTVWGYNGSYPGPTLEARRYVPVTVKWKNELTDNGVPLPHLLPVDTTVHWAMPDDWPACGIPLVTHLHGGHVESASDGNPDAWFTPGFAQTGSYWSQQVYSYPNDQEPATVWYHDHALGITRLNVYAGLAGFFILRDTWEDNLGLPSGAYEIPIAIQDRMFTADGQLYYPSAPEESGQPDPSILPEMFGDFILVNGKTWPALNVEPRKYRFRFLNGSDSRFYKLYFDHSISFVQIGTDGGLLNEPVPLNQLLLGPGERKDVVIDFSNPALWGQTIILKNNARSPFPKGESVNPQTAGQIMAFRVNVPLNGVDNSVIPAVLRAAPIAQLGTPDNTRQLLLIETEDEFDRLKPQLGTSAHGPLDWDDPITENPLLNALEEWQVINFSEDAHPIHLHLVNFQLVSRQKYNTARYIPGNPSSLQLLGRPKFPAPDESGWKDTEVMYPGEVTTVRARFDNAGLYLWHCHILSHEDHEMMRPFYVGTMPARLAEPGHPNSFNIASWPNPFHAQTQIRLEVITHGNYRAEIFNAVGQRVSLLTDTYYEKGVYDLQWNGTGPSGNQLESGVYFLRVTGLDGERNLKLLFYH